MTQRAYANYYTGTPTEYLIIKGKTEAGKEIEMCVGDTMAVEIMTKGAEAYKHCGHVGHALWHVKNKNTDFENCSSCKNCIEEKEQEKKRDEFYRKQQEETETA